MSDPNLKEELKRLQILTLKNNLPNALEYHFSNFRKLEEMARPSFGKKQNQDIGIKFSAMTNIKFEIQAYLCQLRRIKHFMLSKQIKEKSIVPDDPDLKEIWYSILDKNGMVNILANKWATHRSYDDPWEDDTDSTHAEVLINLEGGVTMWEEAHLYVSLGGHQLNLCNLHPKVLRFIEWFFVQLEQSAQEINERA